MKTFVYTGGVNVPDVTPRVPARQLLIGNNNNNKNDNDNDKYIILYNDYENDYIMGYSRKNTHPPNGWQIF